MSAKQSQSGQPKPPSLGQQYVTPKAGQQYVTRQPAQPVSSNRLIDAMADRGLPPEERKSAPPTLQTAFFAGVFEFPFYLSCLGCLLGGSVGFSFTFLVLVFALSQGFNVGDAIRPLGQCAGLAFIFTMGFMTAHCRSIIEETAYGADAIENWPAFDWKGWVATFLFVGVVFLEALGLTYVLALPQLVGQILPSPLNYLPWLGLTALCFPVFLLSALENGAPVPFAGSVLKSLGTIWWAWLLFYVETSVLLIGWVVVARMGLWVNPYLSVFVSGPLLAAAMMIYARLLGRLAWCASQQESDDDDD